MRILLLLLMLSACWTPPHKIGVYQSPRVALVPGPGVVLSYPDSNTVMIEAKDTIPGVIQSYPTYTMITKELILKYVDECYADSTEVTYDWFEYKGVRYKSYPSIDPGSNLGYIGTWSIFEHRDPTFEDFIKWLK